MDMNHQVSKKTVAEAHRTRRGIATADLMGIPAGDTAPQAPTGRSPLLGVRPARQVSASRAAAGAVCSGWARSIPGRNAPPAVNWSAPTGLSTARSVACHAVSRVNAHVNTASNLSHREHIPGRPSSARLSLTRITQMRF